MNDLDWKKLIRRLPPGLTYGEAARRLGRPYHPVRRALLRNAYRIVDGRRYGQIKTRRLHVEDIDWTKSNIEIAREFLVSRERVRVIRTQLGKPFVESRGRKKLSVNPQKKANHHHAYIRKMRRIGKKSRRVSNCQTQKL